MQIHMYEIILLQQYVKHFQLQFFALFSFASSISIRTLSIEKAGFRPEHGAKKILWEKQKIILF